MKNKIIALMMVVLFAIVSVGWALEGKAKQENTNEKKIAMSEGTTFGELGDIGWAVEGK